MRALLLSLLMSSLAIAAPTRKATTDKFARAAGELFQSALEAEDAGSLSDAALFYKQSLDITLHPNTVYNLASVYERQNKLDDAIIEYEAYLALAPKASDANDVRAKIAALEATPAVLSLVVKHGFDAKRAYVLVDGVIVKKPGELVRTGDGELAFDVKLARGPHLLEVYTLIGYQSEDFSTVPGQTLSKELAAKSQVVGNIAVASTRGFRSRRTAPSVARTTVPAGKQLLPLLDNGLECPALTIDAPKNDDVAYLFIKPTESRSPFTQDNARCRKFDVISQVLKF